MTLKGVVDPFVRAAGPAVPSREETGSSRSI